MKFKKYVFPTEQINGESFTLMPLRDGDILLHRRKEMNMTQKQVAEAAGIQLRQYQRAENNEHSFSGGSARIMLLVCDVLRLDPYVFLGKGNEDTGAEVLHEQYVILPQVETNKIYYYIPALAYYLMVCAIPYSKVCTEEEIWDKLKSVYGINTLDVRPEYNSVDLYLNNSFPYWRVVSERGYITGSYFVTKDRQIELLKDEGHNIRQIGNVEKYRVMDFNETRFDINSLTITVRKTDKQIFEKLNKVTEKSND